MIKKKSRKFHPKFIHKLPEKNHKTKQKMSKNHPKIIPQVHYNHRRTARGAGAEVVLADRACRDRACRDRACRDRACRDVGPGFNPFNPFHPFNKIMNS